MNEKLQYAEMLEIPVSTCTITYKPLKKRKAKKRKKPQLLDEEVKSALIGKVNSATETGEKEAFNFSEGVLSGAENAAYVGEKTYVENNLPVESGKTILPDGNAAKTGDDNNGVSVGVGGEVENIVNDDVSADLKEDGVDCDESEQTSARVRRLKKKKKFNFIALQLFTIAALIATIFVTNVFLPDSGINSLFNGVFASQSQEKELAATDYSPVLRYGEDINLEGGVMTFTLNGSLYPPLDGTVSAVFKGEDGKMTIKLSHGKNLNSVFSGLDAAYFSEGDKIVKNLPVGYSRGSVISARLLDANGEVITGYTVENGAFLWAV